MKHNDILNSLSSFYKIPILTIDQILADLLDKDNFYPEVSLVEDYLEFKTGIDTLVKEGATSDDLTEQLKVLVRVVKWRLQQNDCRNRGSILYNYPLTTQIATLIFKTQKPNLLLKLDAKALEKKAKKPVEDGEEPEEEEEVVEPEAENEEETEFKSQAECFCPETVVILKKLNQKCLYKPQVEAFYRSIKLDVYVCDSSQKELYENTENLMINIERNGRPNNYLEDMASLTQKHLAYYSSLDASAAQKQEKKEQEETDRLTREEERKESVL